MGLLTSSAVSLSQCIHDRHESVVLGLGGPQFVELHRRLLDLVMQSAAGTVDGSGPSRTHGDPTDTLDEQHPDRVRSPPWAALGANSSVRVALLITLGTSSTRRRPESKGINAIERLSGRQGLTAAMPGDAAWPPSPGSCDTPVPTMRPSAGASR